MQLDVCRQGIFDAVWGAYVGEELRIARLVIGKLGDSEADLQIAPPGSVCCRCDRRPIGLAGARLIMMMRKQARALIQPDTSAAIPG